MANRVMSNYEVDKKDEEIRTLKNQVEFLSSQNRSQNEEMNEVKELLGLCESKDPTDKDRAHLKTLVRKLKQRNEALQEENKKLSEIPVTYSNLASEE
jgi:chromosome segregation ATPase